MQDRLRVVDARETDSPYASDSLITVAGRVLDSLTGYVANCPGPGSGTQADPFCKIQDGIDAASDGDTVLVADGVYTGIGNKNLDFDGKAITLQSEGDPTNCIIDCQGNGRGVRFISGETSAAVFKGFTIANGDVPTNGGGVLCVASHPTIENCIITGNQPFGLYGHYSNPTIVACKFWSNSGGIGCSDCDPMVLGCEIENNTDRGILCSGNPTITNCKVSNNFGLSGGGIQAGGGYATISNCLIEANESLGSGGGIELSGAGEITNCTIKDNLTWGSGGGIRLTSGGAIVSNSWITSNTAAGEGGGLYSIGSSPIIRNCTITDNISLVGGGGTYWNSQGTLANCILWANDAPQGPEIYVGSGSVTVSYCNVQGGQQGAYVQSGSTLGWAAGNIDVDPLFIDAGNGDYHLSADSPCIDAGDPSFIPQLGETDIDGEDRVAGVRVDMGADEYHDCNGNGVADYLDLAEGASGDCNGTNVPDECEGFMCYDGDACTADSCDPSGVCLFTPISCDDLDACTDDGCDPANGCVHVPIVCEPPDKCSTAVCDPGLGCLYPPVVCDDGDACTTDDCGPGAGCTYTPITCDDGNPCSTESCDPAAGCVAGPPLSCEDNDACTSDHCEPATGCVHDLVVCSSGYVCDPATGACVPYCPTDLNNDGTTNAADLALLLGGWGPNPCHPR